jgi:hypothetical protein
MDVSKEYSEKNIHRMAVEENTRLVLNRRLCCSSTTTHPSRTGPYHHAAVTDNPMYQIRGLVGVAGVMG